MYMFFKRTFIQILKVGMIALKVSKGRVPSTVANKDRREYLTILSSPGNESAEIGRGLGIKTIQEKTNSCGFMG